MSTVVAKQIIDILLVEDSDNDIFMAKKAFKKSGIPNKLHIVTNGVAALEFLQQKGDYAGAPTPDLILLDLNLPKKNGHEVLENVKNDLKLLKIPTIIMTTSSSEEDINLAYQHHANSYIVKPIGIKKLLSVIHSLEMVWFSNVERLPT